MKSIFAGAAFKLLIATALLIIVINDAGSILSTRYALQEKAREIAKTADDYYAISRSESRARTEAETKATELGAILTEFDILNRRWVNLTIEVPNRATWIAHRFTAIQPYLGAQLEYSRDMHQ